LIKYKEDDRGEIFFDEKRMPVIEHEFMNPGVKGENVPEPYRSGSSEVTGFRETMGTFFRGLVGRSGQDVRDFPDSYWQELVG
jgi:hypothetical protein